MLEEIFVHISHRDSLKEKPLGISNSSNVCSYHEILTRLHLPP
jgi:hypothetical protein